MKLVIVSDTHMPRMAKKLPKRLIQELKDADGILHAGDWMDLSDGSCRGVRAYGRSCRNNHGRAIIAKFGFRKVLQYGGIRIGLVHGHGPGSRDSTENNAFAGFCEGPGGCDYFRPLPYPFIEGTGWNHDV